VSQNSDNGLKIANNDVTAGGREVEVTNTTSRQNVLDGAVIDGTDDTDSVSITESNFTDNDENGLNVGADTTIISSSEISQNGGIGLQFNSGIDDGKINRSTILDNSGAEVVNNDESAVIDATDNWWGNPAGVEQNNIEGRVNTGNPLEFPPSESVASPSTPSWVDNSDITPAQYNAFDDGDGELTDSEVRNGIQTYVQNSVRGDNQVNGVAFSDSEIRGLIAGYVQSQLG
jgi:hypothetical protein